MVTTVSDLTPRTSPPTMRRVCRALLLLACIGCTSAVGHAPVARIAASPRAIPERDSYQTDVALDGSGSADPIDDPDATRAIVYDWEISGDDARIASGARNQPRLVVRFFGAHPATIHLTVTDEDGL